MTWMDENLHGQQSNSLVSLQEGLRIKFLFEALRRDRFHSNVAVNSQRAAHLASFGLKLRFFFLEQKRNHVNVILQRATLNVGRSPPLLTRLLERWAWLGVVGHGWAWLGVLSKARGDL